MCGTQGGYIVAVGRHTALTYITSGRETSEKKKSPRETKDIAHVGRYATLAARRFMRVSERHLSRGGGSLLPFFPPPSGGFYS